MKCPHCNKESDNFRPHKAWEANDGHDLWCRYCYTHIATKEEAMAYCWENMREWSEGSWNAYREAAEKQAMTTKIYIKATSEQREKILSKMTCQLYLKDNNKYEDHTMNGRTFSFEHAQEMNLVGSSDDITTTVFSKKFDGHFTTQQLQKLEEYYERLEREYDLDTVNMEDYAKKVCVASLVADEKMDDWRAGRCDYSTVKDTTERFMALSKDANFAACKRKPGESTAGGSFSEIALRLEESGHPCIKKIPFEKDMYDMVLEHYGHIVRSLGLTDQE